MMRNNTRLAPFIRTLELAEKEQDRAINKLNAATKELQDALKGVCDADDRNVDRDRSSNPCDNCRGDNCVEGVPSRRGKGDA